MHTIYNLLIYTTSLGLRLAAVFSKKMRKFVDGRKHVFPFLVKSISPQDKVIWFHCASLGEFEQGVPIMEGMRRYRKDHKFVVSFFSPSGYEIKKNTALADVTVYLPLDTPTNARKFVSILNPQLVFFIKYEFWPNYLRELQSKNIPTLLVSGVFREKQIFFKPYGQFMRQALDAFDHFFVQDQNSKILAESLGLKNVTLSGDTRFDRVSQQIEIDNSLPFLKQFKGDDLCIVCGSTWPEDEEVLLPYINAAPPYIKFVIAPHKIDAEKITNLRKRIGAKTVIHSEKDDIDITQYQVLIIDCVGLLSKIYSYADVAYVGGAMGDTGLHNILEPATFGVPIIIGDNFANFPEAIKLRSLAGLFSISNAAEAKSILEKLINDPSFRKTTGMIAGHFIDSNTGATRIIMDYIDGELMSRQ